MIIGNKQNLHEEITINISGKLKKARDFMLNEIKDGVIVDNDSIRIKLLSNLQYLYIEK